MAKTSDQFSLEQQCIILSDYDDYENKDDDENKNSHGEDDGDITEDETNDDDSIDENLPRGLKQINYPPTMNKASREEEEEEEPGWGSELSDSDLISSEHTTPRGTSMGGQHHNIGLKSNESRIDNDSQETGPHATLHELILAIGQLTNPTHEILDDIWLKLPTTRGLNYPTKTDTPNTLDRQGELLRDMIVLYESISNLAMQNGKSPDLMYSNEHILNLPIGCNDNTNEESLLTFIQ